jgi:putative colanic acid biosynthesis UDP-glucose lipid carrier transferase
MDASSIGKLERATEFDVGSARQSLFSYRTIVPIAVVADILVIVLACALLGTLSVGPGVQAGWVTLGIAPVVCGLFLPAAKLAGAYSPSAFFSDTVPVQNVALLWLGTVALLIICFYSLEASTTFSPDGAGAFILAGLLGLVIHRSFWRRLARRASTDGRVAGRKALLIHQASHFPYLDAVPDLQRHGLLVGHRLNLGSLDNDDDSLLRQGIELAVTMAQSSNADEILVAADVRHWQRLRPHLARLRQLPLPVSLIASDWLGEIVKHPAHVLGSSLLVEVQRPPLNLLQRIVKRTMDLALAAAGLMVLWPLLISVALLIRFDSPGPVLFRQTRIGFNGRAFKIYKFRTMTVLEDGPDIRQAGCEDERVTAFGRWLRKTSIDELPQLFNVLKGDMSLVGPRPHAVSHDNEFGRLIGDYAFRRQMKPGITGWAQVSGSRGATPEVDLMNRRIQLDMLYIDNWSIWRDISIIARTVVTVIRGDNAY